ncbi:MAG: hypothetical protein QXK77_02955 [Archaeoglobaceae archaeon]
MKYGSKEIKLTLILGLLAIAIEILMRFFVKHKMHFPWEEIPGFYALVGFFGCIAISAFSRFVGRKFLMKSPDYYERRYLK